MAARVEGDPQLHWTLGRGWRHLTLCGKTLRTYVVSVVPGPMVVTCRPCWQGKMELEDDDESNVPAPYWFPKGAS